MFFVLVVRSSKRFASEESYFFYPVSRHAFLSRSGAKYDPVSTGRFGVRVGRLRCQEGYSLCKCVGEGSGEIVFTQEKFCL